MRDGAQRLVAEDDVLHDREVVGEHEVLVHHADADSDRVGRRLEVGLVPSDQDRSLVGPVHPVEDLHQRRLAGPVLTDDRVDRAGCDPQVMSSLAITPGNGLPMPPSSTAGLPSICWHNTQGAADDAAAPRARSWTVLYYMRLVV